MKIHKEVEFSWSSYFKPTPPNIQKFVEAIKGILVTVAATQFVMKDEKLTIYFLVAAGVLDYASKFFAHVAKDYQEIIKIEAPQEVMDEIKVTTEKKEDQIN